MTRLVIVRHGNTFGPDEPPRRIGARTDLPLVESGRAQAAALARRFADVRFDRVLSGPLSRTRETAAAITGAERVEPVSWLAEVDHGPDEDRPEDLVRARLGPAALDRWERDGVAPDGWRVDREVRLAAWRALYADARGTLLLVTSNGAARFALLADERLRAAVPSSLKLRTGAWAEIVVTGGVPALVAWDRRP